jgi:hypothetical protein
MPVDYSNFLSQTQPPDVGKTLARVAQIESLRNNNLLAHAQLDDVRRKGEFRNALSSGADQATLRGIDPEAAQSYQQGENALAMQGDQRDIQATAARQEKAQYLSGVLGTIQGAFAKSPEAGMAAAKYYWPEVKAKGFFPGLNAVPDDPEGLKRAVDQFKEHADLSLSPKDAVEPYSDLGKLAADYKAGRIDEAAYRAGVDKKTHITPPAQTNVTVNNGQELAFNKEYGKQLAGVYTSIQDAGRSSINNSAKLDRLSGLLSGVETGKLTPAITEVASLAESLGISIDPNLGAKQAAQSLSNEYALSLRNPSGGAGMPGAMSDADRAFLQSMVPGLSKTPEGRRLIVDTGKKVAKRDGDVARLAREYRKSHGGQFDEGFYEELANYSAKNPLFPAGGPKAFTTQGGATVQILDD